MAPERWHRFEKLLHAAAARQGAEREAFLDEACAGDPELRREVEALLAEQPSADEFLESPAWRASALEPGTRVGPYEVCAFVGAGGMGEVYRAHDTKLGRDVALKILPPAFSEDADRLGRFEREAAVLAALNHQNIAQIYGLEQFELTQAEGVVPPPGLEEVRPHGQAPGQALVLEYVQGPTLDEAIHKNFERRSSTFDVLEWSLPIARQIAEALEAAHEHGIIHRDLKPSNIKVRDDGTVKVLDFGLAREVGRPEQDVNLADSPTVTAAVAGSQAGVVMGTAPYISPEQAKGKLADRRSDIWAFGCVLYEMLTGQRAFPGDEPEEVIAGVLKQEPDWTALPADTPPHIRQLLCLCLQKSPRQRISDAQDVRLALEGTFETALRPVEPPALPFWRRALPIAAALAVGSVATVVAFWGLATGGPPGTTEPTVASFYALSLPDDDWPIDRGLPLLSISWDGQLLVYQTAAGLWVQRTDDGSEAYLVPGSENSGIRNPAISPDKQWLVFWELSATNGPSTETPPWQLRRLPVTGGTPQTICRARRPQGMTWVSGEIYFGQLDGIWSVRAEPGSSPEQVIPAPTDRRLFGPQLLPDGEHLLYLESVVTRSNGFTHPNYHSGRVIVQSLKTGYRVELDVWARDARYVAVDGGGLVYAHGNLLKAVRLHADSWQVAGDETVLVQAVLSTGLGDPGSHFAMAGDGRLAYVPGRDLELKRRMVWVRPGNAPQPVNDGFKGAFMHPRISVSGNSIALTQNGEVWTYAVDRGVPHQVTNSPDVVEQGVMWVGEDLLVTSTVTDGTRHLALIRADGTGQSIPVTHGASGYVQYAGSISRDRDTVVFRQSTEPGGSGDGRPVGTFEVSLADGPDSEGPLRGPGSEEPLRAINPGISAGDKWLVYEIAGEIYVVAYPPSVSARVTKVSANGGKWPVWSTDGSEIYYVQGRPGAMKMMAVAVSPAPGGRITLEQPRELFDASPYHLDLMNLGRMFDVRNGQFLMLQQEADDPPLGVWLRTHLLENLLSSDAGGR